MRKNIFILTITSLMLSLTSCSDYLDMEHFFKDQLDLQDVFESRDYSEQWLAGVYTHLQGANADVASKGHTVFNMISDDMFFGDRDNSYKRYKNGEYDEYTWGGAANEGNGNNGNPWEMCYTGIRDASTFIQHIDINKEMSKT
ncbi:MAG: RagB/SusD family nutrient uptake outer membrane protein, partial [Candidatus Symbiothrix sp.]|nr:RagB/SusD family nutrient uptake outer membrane protein [Candidatus Symbiothrix sp.]